MAEYVVVDKEQLEADLTTVADAIREKSGTTEDLDFPLGMKEVVESIDTSKEEQEKTISITENGTTSVTPDEGKVLSKVTVNVEVQGTSNGETINLLNYATFANGQIFRDATFPENTRLDIKLNLVSSQNPSLGNQFSYSRNIERVKLDITNVETKSINMGNAFASCRSLKEVEFVGDTKCITNSGSIFYECILLETIHGVLNFSLGINMVRRCERLKNITFAENIIVSSCSFLECGLLSDESIQSIIDGLATVETSQTLTLHADVKAKLTETQIATITSKNWTLA